MDHTSIWFAIIALSILTTVCGTILGYVAHYFTIEIDPIIKQIDDILPQINCGQCGYPNCASYAKAVSQGEQVNLCSPGGNIVALSLAKQINNNLEFIERHTNTQASIRMIAIIHEDNCIGCTKCNQICPVDAIIGTMYTIHTVITDFCIGCNLCVKICPAQCISMHLSTNTYGR